MIKTDVLIIGGGLCGLTLSHYLRKNNIDHIIVEARERLGGRIHTLDQENDPTVEMGATWLGPEHTRLLSLLKELDIGLFKQVLGETAIYEQSSMSSHQLVTLPQNQQPSYRIIGGSKTIIERLAEDSDPRKVFTGRRVNKISENENGVRVITDDEVFQSKIVVSTLPPVLLQKKVRIDPLLPDGFRDVISETHTWMGESIKIGLTYERPFWRDPHKSGTIFSNVGPITEMYDHSDHQDEHYALKGFLNGSYFSVSREDRLEMVLKQLRKYYGAEADHYIQYHETVWTNEEYTYVPYDEHVLPHQNNGHEMYHRSYLNGKLYIAGAETSPVSPGYMDGAVSSAEWVSSQILDHMQDKERNNYRL